MITLDSASGIIDIPKVNDYEELMRQIKQVLQINDELFQHLYFSFIDVEDQERTRLIPQIYEDFINQESPKLSIGFLDNLNQEILDQFTEIIDANKKRFEKEKELDKISNEDFDESNSKKQKENIKINLSESLEILENNLNNELKIEDDIPSNNNILTNKDELEENHNGNKKGNDIPEKGIIIINNEEKDEMEKSKDNDIPEKEIIIINNEEKNEIEINKDNENENNIEIISSQKLINEKNINENDEIINNIEIKNINNFENNEIKITKLNNIENNNIENNDEKKNNNNIILKRLESDNCFNLFSSDYNYNEIKANNNINNNKENIINEKKNGELDDS